MNNKLSSQEWNKLDREQQKAALLNFTAPNPLPIIREIDINKHDYNRFK